MKRDKSAYSKKLLDPRWQKKRLEILERDNWTCQLCGETTDTLHVHHRSYIYGNDPWEYPNTFFVTLCASCHEDETESFKYEFERITERLKLGCFSSDVAEFTYTVVSAIDNYGANVGSSFLSALMWDKAWRDEVFEQYKQKYPHRFGGKEP